VLGITAVTFSPCTALAVLRPFLPTLGLLRKQLKHPYPDITALASLQIIPPSNSPEKVAQAVTKSQPQTSSTGKTVPKTGAEDETGQAPGLGGLAGGPGPLGGTGSFGLCMREEEREGDYLSPPHNPCAFSPVL